MPGTAFSAEETSGQSGERRTAGEVKLVVSASYGLEVQARLGLAKTLLRAQRRLELHLAVGCAKLELTCEEAGPRLSCLDGV